jgi:carboxypeptidase Q
VPGFFWRQDGRARYQRTHHTQYDTFEAAVPEYQRHSSMVVALAAYGIADLDHLLSREKLRASGTMANRRTLGAQLDELTVVEVVDDGVAQKAGIKDGDAILKIDGTNVADRTELTRLLRTGEPKKVVTILRDGKEVDISVSWEPAAAATSTP